MSIAYSMPYHTHEVDLAGNDYVVFKADNFKLAREQLLTAQKLQPFCHHYLINSDHADIDSDGLTDEEWELLP